QRGARALPRDRVGDRAARAGALAFRAGDAAERRRVEPRSGAGSGAAARAGWAAAARGQCRGACGRRGVARAREPAGEAAARQAAARRASGPRRGGARVTGAARRALRQAGAAAVCAALLLAGLALAGAAAPPHAAAPPSVDLAALQAALGRGAFSEVIDQLEQWSDQGLVHPTLSFDRGVAYLGRAESSAHKPSDLGQAAAAFEEALALDPSDDEARVVLGRIRETIS